MSSFFRSEQMNLYSFLMPRESAYNLLNQLGDLNMLHFVDADPSTPYFNRPFYNNIKRIEDLLKIIKEIIQQMNQLGISSDLGQADVQEYLNTYQRLQKVQQIAKERYLDEIEYKLNQYKVNIEKNINVTQEIIKQANILIQQRACLENSINLNNFETNLCIGKLIGTINTADSARFYKLVFRQSKGNCFTTIKDIHYKDMPILNPLIPSQELKKSYFQLIFNTSQSRILNNKLIKICNIFDAQIFNDLKFEQLEFYNTQYLKSKEILKLTYLQLDKQFDDLLAQTDNISLLEYYYYTLLREKCIYHHLNLTKSTHSVLKGLLWLPKQQEYFIFQQLNQYQEINQAHAQMHLIQASNDIVPPTKIMNNEFLYIFQEVVNTYGVPRYQEINPGLYGIVTFPFLFGVMFGDIGHGLLLASFGIYLIFKCDKNLSQQTLFKCRYLIAMMGFFAVYCGVIYNDFMSLSLDLFGSCYKENQQKQDDCTYMVGIDPIWMVSSNSLQYYNSFKMKQAIILGVFQMTIGIFLKGLNAIFQKSLIDFLFEFVPQILFMLSTFGYMSFLIIIKWLSNFEEIQPPSILNIMLNIPLKLGFIKEEENLLRMFDLSIQQQSNLHFLLLCTALICIPLMLLPKPLLLAYQNKHKQELQYVSLGQNDEENLVQEVQQEQNKHNQSYSVDKDFQIKKHREEFDFSEVFVHQVIESIEFVLGSISHTASYLRLWALSLAHSQLSHVFFQKTLESSIESGSVFGIIIGFLIFASVTFGVLMCMDVLECFLHTLRLHWVEFQSKFYKADGILFKSFSFIEELQAAEKINIQK